MHTTNEYPDGDRSKHDPDVAEQLFLLRLSHRVSNCLCVFCGKPTGFGVAACNDCKEERRQKRIREAGYDHYEGLFNSEE